MIHPLADVQSQNIGEETTIWQFSVVLRDAKIGSHCNINCHTFIENKVVLGDYVTVKSGVYLWDGITVENHVFIGPNSTFTNDKRPRSKQYPPSFQQTVLKHHASIGAGATILGGVTVGEYATVGANSLVTKDVPARSLVFGQPARIQGWVNEDGSPMESLGNSRVKDNQGKTWVINNNQLQLL